MSDIYNVSKQQLNKIGGEANGLTTTYEVKKAQVEKLGGDLTKVNDIYTAELQVLEHIDGGGGGATLQEKSVSITANGTTDVMPDAGYDGMTKVSVDVEVPVPNLQSNKIVYTGQIITNDNFTVKITPDEGYDGLKKGEIRFSTKIPIAIQDGTKFQGSSWESWNVNNYDTTNVKNFDDFFRECFYLYRIDTSIPTGYSQGDLIMYNCTTMQNMCYGLNISIANLYYIGRDANTTNINADSALAYCSNLESVMFDSSYVGSATNLFYNDGNLTTLEEMNCEYLFGVTDMFYNCSRLANVGGFKDLGLGSGSPIDFDLSSCPLSSESVQNIVDKIGSSLGGISTIYFNSSITLSDEQIQALSDKQWSYATK